MRVLACMICLLLTAICSVAARGDEEKNILINGNFSAGLQNWTTEGSAAVESGATLSDGKKIVIGPGKGALKQKLPMQGLHILLFSANLKPELAGVGGTIRIQCRDAKNHLLMDLHQDIDGKKAAADGGARPGIYFKTHAFTANIVVSIEKTSDVPGKLTVDTVTIAPSEDGLKLNKPECDLDQYMQPFWKGKTVYNEMVLMLSENGKPATGRLMYTPTKILSIQDARQEKTYIQGQDFTVSGNSIISTAASNLPGLHDVDFDAGEQKWYRLEKFQIVVTYTHDDVWKGHAPSYAGNQLPNTMNKLARKAPLTIVALGDSITVGVGSSGFSQLKPFMPPWTILFKEQLKKVSGNKKIQLYNTALGGMTSEWGKENATDAVASLHPDLVLIAFGMNDFWSLSGDSFKANIQRIIDLVRAKNPRTEFILISSTRFDPAFSTDVHFRENMVSYVTALKSLTGKGIQLLDMDAISGALGTLKKPKDLTSDPMHPNDFVARWFAQGLVAMLDKDGSNIGDNSKDCATTKELAATDRTPKRRRSGKKGLGIYPEILAHDPAGKLNIRWYYNWTSKPFPNAPKQVEFIPMVFSWYGDKEGEERKAIAEVKHSTGARYLLGYNEPDGSDQAALTPSAALAPWPLLMETGLTLGAPAAVNASGDWMKAFMIGAKDKHYKVDFIPIHWYYLTEPESFLGFVKKIHDLYKKPIWITEFANVDWDQRPGAACKFTPHQVAEFLRAVLPKLDKLSYVQRYAWFTTNGDPYSTSSLFNADGSLTEAGEVYAAF